MVLPKRYLLERTSDAKDLPIPARRSAQASGLDLHANIKESVTIKKGECVLIPAGIKIALPFGFEAQIRSRSGLALNHGIVVLNSPGTIDADYRGEIKILLMNHGIENFEISRGDRIAQMVICKVEMMDCTEVEELPETKRGEDGLGSTGIKHGNIDLDAFEKFKQEKMKLKDKIGRMD